MDHTQGYRFFHPESMTFRPPVLQCTRASAFRKAARAGTTANVSAEAARAVLARSSQTAGSEVERYRCAAWAPQLFAMVSRNWRSSTSELEASNSMQNRSWNARDSAS